MSVASDNGLRHEKDREKLESVEHMITKKKTQEKPG